MATSPIDQIDAMLGLGGASPENQYGPKNEKLPEPLQNALKTLVRKYAGQEKYPRRVEVIEARRQRFYARDVQYIYWNTTSMMFATATAGAILQNGDTSVRMPKYTDVYNIYRPYMRALTAVLSQNPPGVNFEPDDPMKSVDITKAQAAEKYRHAIDKNNNRKALQSDIVSKFATDGRVCLYTRYVVDEQRFGIDDQGQPRGAELTTAYGVLEHKCPITVHDQSLMPYQILADEVDINIAKSEYPDAASKIKKGSASVGESAYERLARMGVMQGTKFLLQGGDAYEHLVTRQRCFLRPQAFEEIADEEQDAVKQELKQLFSKGCTVVFCGDTYCEALNESMDDHLVIGHPFPGDGQNRPSMMSSMVPVQDAFNDYKNMEKEYHDYGIPMTWTDSGFLDIDALREQTSQPGNYGTGKQGLPPGAKVSDMFFTETPITPPESLLIAYQFLQGEFSQFLTGALPALFGGGDKNNETLGGIAMLRDQAMGQMALPWGSLQELMARMYEQAVLCAAENAQDDAILNVDVPSQVGKSSIAQIPMADLKKGDMSCRPDQDSSFPETTGAKRQTLVQLWTQAAADPEAAQVMGLLEPNNLELTREWMGLGDWVIPGAEARNKQLREIEILLKTKPLPPSPEEVQALAGNYMMGLAAAKTAGQMPPPEPDPMSLLKSSVPINPEDDYNDFEAEECKRWLSSEECWEQIKLGNQAGVQNVRLHRAEHMQAAAAQQMAAQQAMAAANPQPQPGNAKGEPAKGKPPQAANAPLAPQGLQ